MADETRRLIVQRGDDLVQTVAIDRPALTIGRTPDNDLSLPDTLVSRHHAEIRLEPEGLTLTDLHSSNGTFVDGARLPPNQPRLLTNGARIQIGPFLLTYQVGEADDGPASATDMVAVEMPPIAPVQMMQPVHALARTLTNLPRPTLPGPVASGPTSMYI